METSRSRRNWIRRRRMGSASSPSDSAAIPPRRPTTHARRCCPISKPRWNNTPPPGVIGSARSCPWMDGWTAPRPSAGPVPRCWSPTNRRAFSAGPSRVSRFPGAFPRGTATWVATTWCGPAIWWRPPARSWPWAPAPRRAASCATSAAPRRPMGTGPRTSGSTGRRTGAECRWMRRRFRSSWWTSPRGTTRSTSRTPTSPGRWCAGRRGSWCGTVPSPCRIAGRRTPATRRSRSRWRSRRCSRRPTWPTGKVSPGWPRICERPPTPGTPRSRAGLTRGTPTSPGRSA